MRFKFLIAGLSILAMFIACDSEPSIDNNGDAGASGVEIPDDGMKWVANAPCKAEFDRIVLDKTWVKNKTSYFDSRGHELSFHYGAGGGEFEPQGFMLGDTESLLADSGVNSGGRIFRCKYTRKWIYDEKTGRLSLFSNEIVKPNSWYSNNYCLVESLTEGELVLTGQFGILANNLYEVEANGMDWSYLGEDQDEGSFTRVVYKPVPADEAAAFWEEYPER